MPNTSTGARAAHLVLDASGSTLASGLNDALNQALPHLVDACVTGSDATDRLAVVVAATRAGTLLPLTRPGDIAMIPAVVAGGIAALAPALDRVADSVVAERLRAEGDGETDGPVRTTVLLVCDGHPVDGTDSLAAAIDRLRAVAPGLTLGVAVAGPTVRTDLAAGADTVVDVTGLVDDPAGLGAALAAALLA